MGNPINIPKTNKNNPIHYNLRGKIPSDHLDMGKGLCPFDKRHNVHLISNHYEKYTPMKYVCINCGFTKEVNSI